MTYQPDEAFAGLFFAFTGGQPESIGAQLTQTMVSQSKESPLLVSTASDIAYFPGGHSKPSIESFRKSTRGFIELTAVSHLPLAVCYVAHMRELLPGAETWRVQLQRLIEHAVATRRVNTVDMWRDKVALRAFQGHERKLCGLVEYALTSCIDYMQRACIDPSLLDFVEYLLEWSRDHPLYVITLASPELHERRPEIPLLVVEGRGTADGLAQVRLDLSELRNLSRNSKQYIAQMEERERKRTGIASLKVKFNSVFGYFIEISKANLKSVPAHYERRQTLSNAERYTTPELKEMESKVLGAEVLSEVLREIKRGAVATAPNNAAEGTYYSFPTRTDVLNLKARGRAVA